MSNSFAPRRGSLLSRSFAVEPLEVRRLLASISGEVYNDFNGNGKLDPGESGAAFQSQLIFLDQNNNGVADPGELSTSVDPFGDYSFGPLAAGTYRVRLQQDQGFARTSPSTDSYLVTVTASQAVTGKNFGITEPSSYITGNVFNDANGNAKQDPSEPALQGATPYLDLNNNGKLDSAKKTLSSTNVPVTAAGISAAASNLTVSGLTGFVLGVTVKVNITSPNDNDPDVFLEDPQGVRVELVDPVDTASQDNGHNFVNTVFDDNASKPISSGKAPFTGSFQTSGLARGAGLGDFKNLSPNGTWRLILEDTATPNTAKLTSWSITLTTGDPTTFQKSHLGGDYFILSLYPGTYKVRSSDTNFITTFPTAASGQSYTTKLTEGTIKTDNFGMREVNTVKQTVTFSAATNITHLTEDSPFGVVTGDFNKDGKLDLATINNGSDDVSIYLGKGNGTFSKPVFYPVGSAPRGIAMADLNGDGNLDLVVTNHDNDDIAVLLGNGNGTFKPRVTYAVGGQPWTIALADVTGDGKLDAIVGSNGIPDVTILPGKGNGTFDTAHAITVPAGFYPMGVRVADMNGDGKPDIITCNSLDGTVGVLLSKGHGVFSPVITTHVGNDPEALNVVDLNGDKKMDVVVANQGDDTIDVLLGKGNGTFQVPETYPTGDTPAAVNIGDLNNDGKPDIIISDRSDGGTPISGDVRVYLSNGDGTLQPPFIYTAHTSPVWAAVGDFNKDGKLDLAVANFNSDDVSVLLNTTTPFIPH